MSILRRAPTYLGLMVPLMKRYVVNANTRFTTVSAQIIIRYQFTSECVLLHICAVCLATLETVKVNRPMKMPKKIDGMTKTLSLAVEAIMNKSNRGMKWRVRKSVSDFGMEHNICPRYTNPGSA